jgi:hypothetical protein
MKMDERRPPQLVALRVELELRFDVLRMRCMEGGHVHLIAVADGHPHVYPADDALLGAGNDVERRRHELRHREVVDVEKFRGPVAPS